MVKRNNGYSQKTLDLASELIGVRDAIKNDRKDCATRVLAVLDYKNNTSTKVYEFDAFLIKAVTEKFGGTNRFDIVLMAFGLLDEYDYKKTSIGTRREKYLIESDYLKTNPREKVKSYIDANERAKKRLRNNLRNGPEKTNIAALADFLINKKERIEEYMNNIDGYVDKICDDKNNVLYSAKLPVPFYKQSQKGTISGFPNRPSIENIGTNHVDYYIESIRFSEHYDDMAKKLYEALCGQGEPPYDEWVATWILKCIRKTFHETLSADIMLASFALLNGFSLSDIEHERRLWIYLRKSLYYETAYTIHSRHRIHLPFVALLPSEENKVMEALKKDEQALIDELLLYIKGIKDPNKHIEVLNGYGKYIPENNSYDPFMQEMSFRKDHEEQMQGVKNAAMVILCLVFLIGVGAPFIRDHIPHYEEKPFTDEQGKVPDYIENLEIIDGSIPEVL